MLWDLMETDVNFTLIEMMQRMILIVILKGKYHFKSSEVRRVYR
jgi:hypothetical protein